MNNMNSTLKDIRDSVNNQSRSVRKEERLSRAKELLSEYGW